MSTTVAYGPNGTVVGGLADVVLTFDPLNFVADFRIVEEGVGKAVYTDITAPQDRPSTLRIAQSVRPNVYAGTGISDSAMLPSRKGTDTVVEIKEVWEATDSVSGAITHLPVRLAITANLPQSSLVTADAVERLITRALASLYSQADGDMSAGLNTLLRGVVKKG